RSQCRSASPRLTGECGLLPKVRGKNDIAPDHLTRDLLWRCIRRAEARDRAAMAHHRDGIRDAHHLVELVRDEHDCLASIAHLPKHLPELHDLGGRQHCCRLVEDEYTRAAVQRLENLDSLPL